MAELTSRQFHKNLWKMADFIKSNNLEEKLEGVKNLKQCIIQANRGLAFLEKYSNYLEYKRYALVEYISNLRNAASSTVKNIYNWNQYDIYQLKTKFIYDDLVHLSKNSEFDFKEKTLTFRTKEITLEGVNLGAFDIKYDVRFQEYSVAAVNPPHEDADHPHVKGGSLCEGEGEQPIALAIKQARLCDLFDIIESILSTYNEDSPHYNIELWKGQQCEGCSEYFQDDIEECSRYRCHRHVCSNCSNTCTDCDNTFCSNHIGTCEECQEPLCDDCVYTFDDDGYNYCSDCYKKLKNQKEEEEDADDKELAENHVYQIATGFPPFEESI